MKVKKAQVRRIVDQAFPNYKGHTFNLQITDEVCYYDLNWSGGSRNEYRAVRLDNDHVGNLPSLAPWDNIIEGQSVNLPKNVAVVCHSIFCGHDCGLTIYLCPVAADRLLN